MTGPPDTIGAVAFRESLGASEFAGIVMAVRSLILLMRVASLDGTDRGATRPC